MNGLSKSVLSVAVAAVISSGALAQNAPTGSRARSDAPAADNTTNNDPKRSGAQPTADEQSNSKADMELTQRIRRSVMDDKDLSVYGQNVKIVSAGGKVTLNGVVRTADEKKQIGMKAASVAGADHVMNELKVAPAN